jgi:hypothetical protein
MAVATLTLGQAQETLVQKQTQLARVEHEEFRSMRKTAAVGFAVLALITLAFIAIALSFGVAGGIFAGAALSAATVTAFNGLVIGGSVLGGAGLITSFAMTFLFLFGKKSAEHVKLKREIVSLQTSILTYQKK